MTRSAQNCIWHLLTFGTSYCATYALGDYIALIGNYTPRVKPTIGMLIQWLKLPHITSDNYNIWVLFLISAFYQSLDWKLQACVRYEMYMLLVLLAHTLSTNPFLKWPKWHSHCKDHWWEDVSRRCQDMIAEINKKAVLLQRWLHDVLTKVNKQPPPT